MMLQDKHVALDFLMDSKASVIDLTRAAAEASSPQLKQILIQMRNQAEQTHEEIYHIAENTGGYISAAPADHRHVQRVAQFFQQNMVNQGAVGDQYQSRVGGRQYVTTSYQNNTNYGNDNQRQYQGRTSYYENVDPLKGQGSQYYRSK